MLQIDFGRSSWIEPALLPKLEEEFIDLMGGRRSGLGTQ